MGIQIPLCEQCDLVPQPKATTIAKGCVCTWPMEAGPKDEIDSQLHHDGPLLTTNWPLIYHYLSMRFACSKGRQRLFQGLPHVCIGHRSVNDAQERSQMAKKKRSHNSPGNLGWHTGGRSGMPCRSFPAANHSVYGSAAIVGPHENVDRLGHHKLVQAGSHLSLPSRGPGCPSSK